MLRDEIEARVEDLMAGAYYPYDPGNLLEALQEAGDRRDEICRHLAAGEYAQAGKVLAEVTVEYWRYWAYREADREVRRSMSDSITEEW